MAEADRPDNVLIVLSSHADLGGTGRKTGFYFDEMATPYWALVDSGYGVELASIAGGAAPWDPASLPDAGKRPPAVQRFLDDPASMAKLKTTRAVAMLRPDDYRAVFLPGGHGAMWDFTDSALASLIGTLWDRGAVIGAVCHGPAGLVNVRRNDGKPLVEGRKVSSFTNAEEAAVELTTVVPFLLETELRKRGALFESSDPFREHAVRDGRLITGQNPQSADRVAALLVGALAEQRD